MKKYTLIKIATSKKILWILWILLFICLVLMVINPGVNLYFRLAIISGMLCSVYDIICSYVNSIGNSKKYISMSIGIVTFIILFVLLVMSFLK